jgi:hypothetical protein
VRAHKTICAKKDRKIGATQSFASPLDRIRLPTGVPPHIEAFTIANRIRVWEKCIEVPLAIKQFSFFCGWDMPHSAACQGTFREL